MNLECVAAQSIHPLIYNMHPLRTAGQAVNFNRVTVGIRLQYRERWSFLAWRNRLHGWFNSLLQPAKQMYLLWLLNNLNTQLRASSLLRMVDFTVFVSKPCQSHLQQLLWHELISICPNRQTNTPGCRGPWRGAVHPCSSPRPSAWFSLICTRLAHSLYFNCFWLQLQRDWGRTEMLWSKTPEAPRDTAGVLLLLQQGFWHSLP